MADLETAAHAIAPYETTRPMEKASHHASARTGSKVRNHFQEIRFSLPIPADSRTLFRIEYGEPTLSATLIECHL
jgi:hypothetical protein